MGEIVRVITLSGMVSRYRIVDKPSRPPVLGGITVKVITGCGNMYVQLNWYLGRLFEIFATLGHAGGCATCEMEALTRSITIGLKSGIPVTDYVRQLRGIRCHNPMPFPRESAVFSCPDAIAKMLSEYGSLEVDAVISLLRGANGYPESAGSADSSGDGVELSSDEVESRVRELTREREAQGIYD